MVVSLRPLVIRLLNLVVEHVSSASCLDDGQSVSLVEVLPLRPSKM